MTLYQIVSYLKQIALSSPYIRTAEEGSVYTIMNGNPHSKYGVFVVSQTIHRQDEIFDYYGLNLFVIDRLVDDLESNRLQIQSLAKEVLANTILTFVTKFYGITHNELQFHPFTEKFVDLTAGQYVQVTFQVPRNLICPDDYNLDFYDKYRLLPLNVEITDNGIYEYTPVSEDYDGYDSVKITVNVPQTGASINNQTKTVEVVENGDYTIAYDDGYTGLEEVNFKVDVSGYTQEDLDDAYESGITSGITYQKSLLQDLTIEHNGEYTNENGYSAITVNVPQSGESIYNQTKSIEYSGNGEYTLTYDEGYTGLEVVNINVNVPQSAYTSGYTEQDLIDAYNSGITYQKSLLSATAFTENGNYTSENGYSAVTVNVDTDAWYQSGFTDGFESGKTYSNGRLNITFESENLEGLINEAGVEITYSGISTTIYYTGNTISVSIMAGFDYTITYLPVDNYLTPKSYSFTSKYRENKNISCFYKYQDPTLNYENMYLTIEALSDGTLYWKANNNPSYTKTIQYSTDGGNTWTSVTSSTQQESGSSYVSKDSGTVITTVQVGDKVLFKGSNSSYSNGNYGTAFKSDANISVYGNIMSLIYNDNYYEQTSIIDDNAFSGLFDNCSGLVDAYYLKLPATSLTKGCYSHLFDGCINLKYAPSVLPANTLTESCYLSMFWGCSSLTIAPELPATTLAINCYNGMFYDCTSLTTAPELPATILVERCYMSMFYFCRRLNYIKCLATDLSAPDCKYGWVTGVQTTSGTFVKAAGVTWSSGIPNNWTVIEE